MSELCTYVYPGARGKCNLPESDLLHAVEGTSANAALSVRQRLILTDEIGGMHPFTTDATDAKTLPIPMILTCPQCTARHIDEGEFATKPHHTHACQICGSVWRPALVNTVGVQFLPGFKNEA